MCMERIPQHIELVPSLLQIPGGHCFRPFLRGTQHIFIFTEIFLRLFQAQIQFLVLCLDFRQLFFQLLNLRIILPGQADMLGAIPQRLRHIIRLLLRGT